MSLITYGFEDAKRSSPPRKRLTMHHYDSEEIDDYLVEFESNAELYGNDIETFIERRNIGPDCAQRIRATLRLGRSIDLLAGSDCTNPAKQNEAEDLTNKLKGEYRFIRELGRGGMGTVWLAEQLTPLREVAIKLILTDLNSQLVQRRFEAEQQSLALMSHPSIAKVIDAGSIKGRRPYFVMEYVDGISITEYCNQKQLSLHDRLDLFLQLCDAIQHAHQNGIIHRDIKPGNILVTQIDGKPQIKVIDFGLGKIISGQGADLHLTQANVVIGSPMWMSPEQTRCKTKEGSSSVDTRSDIYSLGVILYHLLTNTTPIDSTRFEDADRSQLFEAIRNEIPPYPSRRLTESKETRLWLESQSASGVSGWRNTLRDDLDWVTMKALEKEPDRRYATVAALAEDLRRFMSGDTVIARPPSATYQLKKYINRNKAVSIATVVATLALIACTGVSIWFGVKSNRASITAVKESERADEATRLAEEQKAVAVGQTQRLDRVLEGYADQAVAANVYASGVKYSKARHDQLIKNIELIDSLNLEDPDREIKQRMPLAESLYNIGEVSLAKKEYEKILDVSESEFGKLDPTTMRVRNALAFICLERNDKEAAREILAANKELLAREDVFAPDIQLRCELGLLRANFKPKNVEATIDECLVVISKCKDQLVEMSGSESAPRLALAILRVDGLTLVGRMLSYREKYEEADQILQKAKLYSDQLHGDDSMASLRLEVEISSNKLPWKGIADIDVSPAHIDEFEEKLGEGNPVVNIFRCRVADLLQRSMMFDKSLEVIEKGILACQRRKSDRKLELAHLWFAKLGVLGKAKCFSDATKFYEAEVAPYLLDNIKPDSSLNLALQFRIAKAYLRSGDTAQALNISNTYEPVARHAEGDWSQFRNNFLNLNARILEENGQYDEAVDVCKEIAEGLKKGYAASSPKVSFAEYRIGTVLDQAGRPMEALRRFEHVNETIHLANPLRLVYKIELAEHYLYARQHEEAVDLCKEIRDGLLFALNRRDVNELRFRSQFCQAEAAAHLGELDVATEVVAKIRIDVEKYKYLRKHPAMNRLDLIKGICQRQKEEFGDAEELLLSGLSKVSETTGLERLHYVRSTLTARRYAIQLGMLYEKWGKKEKAKQFRDMKFEFEPLARTKAKLSTR